MTLEEFLALWHNDSPLMEVHTSGSTGKPKTIWVEKNRMRASARMTCNFLSLRSGDTALLCLPLDYIAGKMMVVRAQERRLRLFSVPPSSHPLSPESLRSAGSPQHIDLAAMVPLQAWNTLQCPAERQALCSIRHLIVGGGAISAPLERELRTLPVHVWSSYGMTETLSHIALRPIGEEAYTPLPGILLSQDVEGCLVVNAPELCPQPLVTNDIVHFVGENRFVVLGRRDNVICSGGIKVQIEEVEAWLQGLGIDWVTVTSRPDDRLGQAVVWLTTRDIVPSQLPLPTHRTESRYWLPRHIVRVESLPLTPNGKPDRQSARQLALAYRF